MRTCPKCKKTIENDKALFCRYCGHELSVAVEPPPAPEPEATPKPAEQPEEEPEEKPVAKPAAKPAEQPIVQPIEKPEELDEANGSDDADDDVEIAIIHQPPPIPPDVDLLDVPTGISTYREDQPKVNEAKPVEEKPQPTIVGGQLPKQSSGASTALYVIGFFVILLVVALGVFFFMLNNNPQPDYRSTADVAEEQYESTEAVPAATAEQEEREAPSTDGDRNREQSMRKFGGSYTLTQQVGSYNQVSELVLDPVNRSCSKVVDDGVGEKMVNISNSIGYFGSEMRMPAYWNILSFNISSDGRSALVEMIPEFGDDVRPVSKVKLTLDDYSNITMSHVSGDTAPVDAGETLYLTRD